MKRSSEMCLGPTAQTCTVTELFGSSFIGPLFLEGKKISANLFSKMRHLGHKDKLKNPCLGWKKSTCTYVTRQYSTSSPAVVSCRDTSNSCGRTGLSRPVTCNGFVNNQCVSTCLGAAKTGPFLGTANTKPRQLQ